VSSHRKILISYFFGDASIPLGESCARALQSMGYEVACFDSGVESRLDNMVLKWANKLVRGVGLKHLDPFGKSSWTHHALRQRLLQETIASFRPDILLVLRGHGFSAEFLADMKQRYAIAEVVGWWVKGPKWIDLMLSEAGSYDRYFCIHREGYSAESGIELLPAVAVDDVIYRKLAASEVSGSNGVVFVGSWNERRQGIIENLKGFPLSIYGPKWHRKNLFNPDIKKAVRGDGIWGEKLCRLYNDCRIALNISSWDPSQQSGLNLRVLDIVACGAFLLTDHSDELAEYFTVGTDIETYRDIGELRDKLGYYLNNREACERIAQNGYSRLQRLATYRDRMRALIERIA